MGTFRNILGYDMSLTGSVQEMRVDDDSAIAPLRLGFQQSWLLDFLPMGPI